MHCSRNSELFPAEVLFKGCCNTVHVCYSVKISLLYGLVTSAETHDTLAGTGFDFKIITEKPLTTFKQCLNY